jgi:hypothetical protein
VLDQLNPLFTPWHYSWRGTNGDVDERDDLLAFEDAQRWYRSKRESESKCKSESTSARLMEGSEPVYHVFGKYRECAIGVVLLLLVCISLAFFGGAVELNLSGRDVHGYCASVLVPVVEPYEWHPSPLLLDDDDDDDDRGNNDWLGSLSKAMLWLDRDADFVVSTSRDHDGNSSGQELADVAYVGAKAKGASLFLYDGESHQVRARCSLVEQSPSSRSLRFNVTDARGRALGSLREFYTNRWWLPLSSASVRVQLLHANDTVAAHSSVHYLGESDVDVRWSHAVSDDHKQARWTEWKRMRQNGASATPFMRAESPSTAYRGAEHALSVQAAGDASGIDRRLLIFALARLLHNRLHYADIQRTFY